MNEESYSIKHTGQSYDGLIRELVIFREIVMLWKKLRLPESRAPAVVTDVNIAAAVPLQSLKRQHGVKESGLRG